jgi:acyl-CoA oxidase
MHAISAAIKARYSWSTLKAAQECRTILGGHGYSAFSKIPSIVDDIDVNVTWEGDNHMLLQQTSKYLMKAISKQLKTKFLDLSFLHSKKMLD